MGSTSKHGRAVINARAPEALGICDRCGFLYNLRSLRFQWDWAGSGMVNRQIRVCNRCYDLPQEQLRTIILPPDPMPARNPRIEAFEVDERNDLNLRPPIGKQHMFAASSDVTAAFMRGIDISASIDGVSDVTAAFMRGIDISASIDGVSDVACDLELVGLATHITTEGGDRIVTEGGDSIITET